MTALEVTHSVTAPEITHLLAILEPLAPAMTDLPYTHRPRLIKPLLSFDSAALALSFLPAAGKRLPIHPISQIPNPQPGSPPPTDLNAQQARRVSDDVYTYHHLRRDLYAMAHSAGIEIESRYVVPSAHITIGRFLVQNDHDSQEKMEKWVREIEGVNEWLEEEVWPRAKGGAGEQGEQGEEGDQGEELGKHGEGGAQGEQSDLGGQGGWIPEGGEWVVGEEKGLDLRKGVLWYGGGETVRLGKGF
jgi:hypothetical protein